MTDGENETVIFVGSTIDSSYFYVQLFLCSVCSMVKSDKVKNKKLYQYVNLAILLTLTYAIFSFINSPSHISRNFDGKASEFILDDKVKALESKLMMVISDLNVKASVNFTKFSSKVDQRISIKFAKFDEQLEELKIENLENGLVSNIYPLPINQTETHSDEETSDKELRPLFDRLIDYTKNEINSMNLKIESLKVDVSKSHGEIVLENEDRKAEIKNLTPGSDAIKNSQFVSENSETVEYLKSEVDNLKRARESSLIIIKKELVELKNRESSHELLIKKLVSLIRSQTDQVEKLKDELSVFVKGYESRNVGPGQKIAVDNVYDYDTDDFSGDSVYDEADLNQENDDIESPVVSKNSKSAVSSEQQESQESRKHTLLKNCPPKPASVVNLNFHDKYLNISQASKYELRIINERTHRPRDRLPTVFCSLPKTGASFWQTIALAFERGRSSQEIFNGLPGPGSNSSSSPEKLFGQIQRFAKIREHQDEELRSTQTSQLGEILFSNEGERLTWTRFITVRHPLDRLYAVWEDNFRVYAKTQEIQDSMSDEDILKAIYHDRHVGSIGKYISSIKIYETAASLHDKKENQRVSFSAWIKWIAFEENSHLSDRIWAPVHDLCAPCDVNYDMILKFESLEQDEISIINRLEAEESLGKLFDENRFDIDSKQGYNNEYKDNSWVDVYKNSHIDLGTIQKIHQLYSSR